MKVARDFQVQCENYFYRCVSTDEMKEIAARICRDYLTGSWKTINTEDIKFKRISGGLSNFLFYVSLPDTCDSNPPSPVSEQLVKITKRVRKDSGNNFIEPKEVLLRIYGQTHGEHALETMLTESVVFALLSERNLGPKLHGIFPGGRIEQYIPARSLITSELSDYRISMKVAEKMAEIHSLDIPVSKEPDWLWKSIDRWLKTAEAILQGVWNDTEHSHKHLIDEIKETNFSTEVKWLKAIIENEDYPVVFCHNDLQEGNILLKEERSSRENSIENLSNELEDTAVSIEKDFSDVDVVNSSKENDKNNLSNVVNSNSRKRSLQCSTFSGDIDSTSDSGISNTSEDCDPELFIIDYEYCAYNYRGFDLANHFLEWTLDYTNKEYPYYYHKKSQYPSKQQRHEFIATYLQKLAAIENENIIPSEQDIQEVDDEVTVFSMVSHLFWCLWSVVNVHQNIEFGYWEYAITRLREYNQAKARYASLCNGNAIEGD